MWKKKSPKQTRTAAAAQMNVIHRGFFFWAIVPWCGLRNWNFLLFLNLFFFSVFGARSISHFIFRPCAHQTIYPHTHIARTHVMNTLRELNALQRSLHIFCRRIWNSKRNSLHSTHLKLRRKKINVFLLSISLFKPFKHTDWSHTVMRISFFVQSKHRHFGSIRIFILFFFIFSSFWLANRHKIWTNFQN